MVKADTQVSVTQVVLPYFVDWYSKLMITSNLKKLMVIAVCLWASACSVQKNFVAIDGSKADALVEVAYQYDSVTEKPVVDSDQAYRVAKERCENWGYADAVTFGLEKETCADNRGPGCNGPERIVSRQFQCTD